MSDKQSLRFAVRNFYGIQRLRIQCGARAARKGEENQAQLSEKDKKSFTAQAEALKAAEKEALAIVKRGVKNFPVWSWLEDQKGIGPTMGALLVAEVDIERAHTPSALWRFLGLAVDTRTGKAERKVKGEKLHYDPWLKAKVVEVLAGSFLKSNSPWRKFYDDYKHRKSLQRVAVCPVCHGKGRYEHQPVGKPDERKPPKEIKPCYLCKGGPGPYPWAKSDAHLHRAAMRYMVKMFLLEFWIQWRTLEGLEVRKPYAEEYLGKVHHACGSEKPDLIERAAGESKP